MRCSRSKNLQKRSSCNFWSVRLPRQNLTFSWTSPGILYRLPCNCYHTQMSLSDDPRSNLGARAQRIDKPVHLVHICTTEMSCQLLPYEDESTASRPICKVKHLTAQSVLRWGTTWEYCGVAISFCQFLQSDRYRESVAERVLARPVRRLANFCSSRDRVA